MAIVKNVSSINQIDIGADIRRDINKSMRRENLEKVEKKVLDKMDEIKNRETRQGNSPAKNGRYDNRYSRQYARREKGGRRSPVTLRNRTQDIQRTRTSSGKDGSELRFTDSRKGRIFWYHDRGINYRRKGFTQRQIYPDADNQVPQALDITARRELLRILQIDG